VAALVSGTAQGTLPWGWYSDPALLEREQERIFAHAWRYAGHGEEPPIRGRVDRWGRSSLSTTTSRQPLLPRRSTRSPSRSRPPGLAGDRGWLDYFFPEEVSDAEVEELLAFDDQVGLEDRSLVESVQTGVTPGLLEGGRLPPESERLLAHFQGLVREALA
jgi:hypothetical protein